MSEVTGFSSEDVIGVVTPIAVLVVGWILALVLGALTRAGLRRTSLDERLASAVLGEGRAAELDTARTAGRVVYYTVLLFTALAFLQVLSLTAAAQPINAMLDSVFAFVPRLLGAALLGLVAFALASVVRRVLRAAVERWGVDRKLRAALDGPAPKTADDAGSARSVTSTLPGAQVAPTEEERVAAFERAEASASMPPPPPVEPPAAGRDVGRTLADASFWLVLLLFVPAVLGTLGLEGLLAPVQGMIDDLLGFLPNLVSAAVIFGVGFFVARVVQRIVTGLLSGVGLDRLSARTGIQKAMGGRSLAALVGIVVFTLILLPVAIGALDALALESVTAPATTMLESVFTAIPLLFAAVLLLGVAYLVARLCASLVENMLSAVGFDALPERLGLRVRGEGRSAPSAIAGKLTLIAIMFFAAVEASRMLGFETVALLSTELATLAGHVLLGLAILAIGLYLANLAARLIARSDVPHPRVLAISARVVILVLVAAMALRQMGIANEIVELAFGLTLGAVAVAGALAFGLGGRQAAGRLLDEGWRKLDRRETYAPPAAEPGAAE